MELIADENILLAQNTKQNVLTKIIIFEKYSLN